MTPNVLFLAPTRAPENLTVVSFIGHEQLKITWNHIKLQYVHGDLKGYKIIYTLKKVAGKVIIQEVKQIKIVHPSVAQVLLTDLEPNAQYDVRVLAFNDYGEGKMSNSTIGGISRLITSYVNRQTNLCHRKVCKLSFDGTSDKIFQRTLQGKILQIYAIAKGYCFYLAHLVSY